MKIHYYLKVLFLLFLIGCAKETPKSMEPNIIPKPLSQKVEQGVFILNEKSNLIIDDELSDVSNYFESATRVTTRIKTAARDLLIKGPANCYLSNMKL